MSLSGPKVFEILANEHAPMLRAFLYSVTRRPEDADDLFQEVLLAAWKSLNRYDPQKPFAPWLRGIAANLVSSWRRSARTRTAILVDENVLAILDRRFSVFEATPSDSWDERMVAMRSCLDELETEDRQVVDLRYQGGLSCEGIAGRLTKGLEWVKKRLQRSRAQLAMCVEGRLTAPGEVS